MKLSIIIPCFNCERTLKEAVDSCYVQDLAENEFEILMVDDGSTDRTKVIMNEIAEEHSNIRLLFHPENRGGGAARNTGIKEATGEIIYCLDSDNFFAPQSVKPMLTYLKETGADGVAFHERRFFIGKNKKGHTPHFNKISDSSVKLFDLLNGSNTLLDNFFYTKEAYLSTMGYPEHHGFDTQSFELRFLSTGHTVRVCPDSIFWHRQAGGAKSYFERVYESGEYSLNLYYMFEDVFHLLSDPARAHIFNYDVFGETKLGTKNLLATLIDKFKDHEDAFFQKNYTTYMQPDGLNVYHREYGERDTVIHALWLYRKQSYLEAGNAFMRLLPLYPNSLLVYFNTLRCAMGSQGVTHTAIERETLKISQSFAVKKQKIDLNPNLFKRIAYKIKTFLS